MNHDSSPSDVSMSTRVTASVPMLVSSTRTRKSTRWMSSIPGKWPFSARRSAWSRAWTGPLPSPTAMRRSSPTQILTVASVDRSTTPSAAATASASASPSRWYEVTR